MNVWTNQKSYLHQFFFIFSFEKKFFHVNFSSIEIISIYMYVLQTWIAFKLYKVKGVWFESMGFQMALVLIQFSDKLYTNRWKVRTKWKLKNLQLLNRILALQKLDQLWTVLVLKPFETEKHPVLIWKHQKSWTLK